MINKKNICPCCSNSMLRHLDGGRSYWFCRNCWLELPEHNVKQKLQINLNYREWAMAKRELGVNTK